MNMGYEEDELKPYQEAQPDLNDQKRIGKTGKEFSFISILFIKCKEKRQVPNCE